MPLYVYLFIDLFISIRLGFSANRGRYTPAKFGVGRALLGMRSPTLREVPNAKIRLSTGAVRIITD